METKMLIENLIENGCCPVDAARAEALYEAGDMDALIKKWGNSHGIRIPKEYLDSLGITPETPLSIEISGNTIVICKKRSHKTLEERVAESGVPLRFSNEINWGKPQGSEVW